MNRTPIIRQISADTEAIVAGLPAALRHLAEWTGEMPTGGSSSSAGSSDDTAPAATGDAAMRIERHLLDSIAAAAAAALNTFAPIDGVRLPVEVVHEAHALAVLRWAVKRLHTQGDAVDERRLDNLSRLVAHARSLVVEHQPVTAVAPQGCRLHATVGAHEPTDGRYRAQGLCRRCGDFRAAHDRTDPTPAILRCWAKGIKPTAAQLAEARSVAKRKAKRKRKGGG